MDENIIAGRNPVREALKAGRPLNKIMISDNISSKVAGEINSLAKKQGTPVQTVKQHLLDRQAGKINHQGIIAIAASKLYVEIEDILEETDHPPVVVVLDEINDPQNLGAILRSADAVGVNGVIVPKRRSAGLTSAVARASAGALEYVPVARVANIPRTIDDLKGRGLWIAGAHGDSEDLFWDVDLTGPIAICIGGEGKGLSRLVREKCDILCRMPMWGNVNSLNASVAAGLFFYEIIRQRRRVENE